MIKVIFNTIRNAHKGMNSLPLGANSFFKRSSHFENDANEEILCLIQ